MAKEIERKFLVKDGWREQVTDSEHLCDGLVVQTRQRKVRIRTSGDKATLAIKDRPRGAERNEFEYPIPIEDARELLAQHCDVTVAKVRHHIHHNGHAWTVDEYQ